MSNGLTNITLNAGTGGSALGVDFDGTANYEVVKLGVSAAGTTPVQVSAANPLPTSLAGANGTVNIVGNVPVTLTGANGTVNVVAFPAKQAVSLAGADGTVNVVGNVPVTLAGANGTVNVVGTVPIQVVGTFTPGTSVQPVSLTGANGTVNVVAGAAVNATPVGTFTFGTSVQPVSLTGANGTVNIVGNVPVTLSGANGTVNIAGSATIAAAAAPNSGLAVLTVYNTAAPAPTSGQSMAAQSDYAGSVFTIKRRAQSKANTLQLAGGGTGTLLAAQAAGIFADLSGLVITFSSAVAAGGTGAYPMALTDGTTTYQFNMFIGTNAAVPPIIVLFDPPLPAGGAAAPWTIRGLSTIATANIIGNFVLQKQA